MAFVFKLNLLRKLSVRNIEPTFGQLQLTFARESEKFAKQNNRPEHSSRVIPRTSRYTFKSAEYRDSLPHDLRGVTD
jgi:hypothetical protein